MEDQSESADAEIVTIPARGCGHSAADCSGSFCSGVLAVKPSPPLHPRQLSDCYFETGHSSVNPMPEIERRGHAVLYMVVLSGSASMCGLLIAGVFSVVENRLTLATH